MKSALIVLFLLASTSESQIPKNNPVGVWESGTGTQYEIRQNGDDVTVKLVAGSNPTYLSYEVQLKNSKDELNTYIGKGSFVAKNKTSNKECRFETEWQMTVVTNNKILGATTNIVPDWDTCTSKETSKVQLDLTKK